MCRSIKPSQSPTDFSSQCQIVLQFFVASVQSLVFNLLKNFHVFFFFGHGLTFSELLDKFVCQSIHNGNWIPTIVLRLGIERDKSHGEGSTTQIDTNTYIMDIIHSLPL